MLKIKKKQYKIEDKMECKVVNIDDSKYRISLSAEECIQKPWVKFKRKILLT